MPGRPLYDDRIFTVEKVAPRSHAKSATARAENNRGFAALIAQALKRTMFAAMNVHSQNLSAQQNLALQT